MEQEDKTEKTTLVRISRELKKHIESKGTYLDSFDDILRRELDFKQVNKFMMEED